MTKSRRLLSPGCRRRTLCVQSLLNSRNPGHSGLSSRSYRCCGPHCAAVPADTAIASFILAAFDLGNVFQPTDHSRTPPQLSHFFGYWFIVSVSVPSLALSARVSRCEKTTRKGKSASGACGIGIVGWSGNPGLLLANKHAGRGFYRNVPALKRSLGAAEAGLREGSCGFISSSTGRVAAGVPGDTGKKQ